VGGDVSEELKQARFANPARINIEMCKALGLDPSEVTSITINMAGSKACDIEVHMFLDTEMAKKVIGVVKNYTLVEST
jgi:hypothetical protein